MNTRACGRTGRQVSEIGFGVWGIGGGRAIDEDSLRPLVHHRWQ